MELRSFQAMGTEIELFVDASNAARELDAVEGEFHRLEDILSRFRERSELSLLNWKGELDASPDLARVVTLALEARESTDGRFDPTVHDAVVSAGYDRSFELVRRNAAGTAHAACCGGAVRVIGSRIELDTGVRLDLGGIGKGYAVDRAAELLAQAGPCLVNAGGDVAVHGGSWPVGVDGAVTLELSGGALATSGRDRRRWRRAGRELHHLIDPSTGAPAETDLLRATAVGSDAVEAEVLAKWLFLLGERDALASRVPCVLVGEDGSVRLGGDLA
jgi:thiamine biosynthesis lipoprotein